MHRVILGLFLAVTLAGCATIGNPIGPVDIWRVKNTYAAALELADEYRTYCWARPFTVLMADPIAGPLCRSRRAVVRKFQDAQFTASAAVITADRFVQDNPTISAASAIGAAWKAVSDFKSAVPAVK